LAIFWGVLCDPSTQARSRVSRGVLHNCDGNGAIKGATGTTSAFAIEASIIEAYARTQTQFFEPIARILGCMSEDFFRTLPKKRSSCELPLEEICILGDGNKKA